MGGIAAEVVYLILPPTFPKCLGGFNPNIGNEKLQLMRLQRFVFLEKGFGTIPGQNSWFCWTHKPRFDVGAEPTKGVDN